MSQEIWEQRYQTHDMPWENGAPSPGLVDFLARSPLAGSGTDLRRKPDYGREIDL